MKKMSMRQPEFIEAKEMVRDAKTQPSTTASVSSYKSLRKTKKSQMVKKLVIYVVKQITNLVGV